jgi:signal transduction histidine kinase
MVAEDAETRIRWLEEELAAAQETIKVLSGHSERGVLKKEFDIVERPTRFEQLAMTRNDELAEKTLELETANRELQHLMKNLDQMVRDRTSALEASEAKLRKKNEELDRLSNLKSEFIGIAAHELRTPMTAILGYSQMMAEQKMCPLPQELERPVAALNRNTQRLRRLIEDMLDVSQLERGKVTLTREAQDLTRLAEAAIAEVEGYVSQYGNSVELVSEGRPLVYVDGDKIHQVIVNLLGNAIKYTSSGDRIFVATGVQEGYAAVRVRDNGAGIPARMRDQLFEPFSNLSEAKHHTSRGPDSAGLGLYIVRGLVDLHDGEIRVVTEEGKGTEFTVLLPLADAKSQSN